MTDRGGGGEIGRERQGAKEGVRGREKEGER